MPRTTAMARLPMLLARVTFVQYGTAPNNYYPDQYTGRTFTGTRDTPKDVRSDHITLTSAKDGKVDTFTGLFETACAVPSTSGRAMMPSDIPEGTVMTAYFNKETKKVDGQKAQENVILAVSFNVWQGQKVAEDKRKIYFCTNDRHLQFRVWNSGR
jgi:hypothetical protein